MKTFSVLLLLLLVINCFSISEINSELNKYLSKNNMVNYSVEAIQDSIFYATNNTIGEDRQFLIISSDNYEAKGYEGNTRLAIFFNYKGVVSTVEIIHSQDTRSFVRRLKRSNFLKQFQNWNGETKIKALTGVTFTSDAVSRTVNNMQKLIIKITTHINKG